MTIQMFAIFRGKIDDDIYIKRLDSLGVNPQVLAMYPTRKEAVEAGLNFDFPYETKCFLFLTNVYFYVK